MVSKSACEVCHPRSSTGSRPRSRQRHGEKAASRELADSYNVGVATITTCVRDACKR